MGCHFVGDVVHQAVSCEVIMFDVNFKFSKLDKMI